MKKRYSILFTLVFPLFLNAQITGDTIVCSGYIYNYNATIVGASTYQWTFPNGWYDLSGQGTSTISATCNVSDGNICVEGFDVLSNSVGTICLTTQFGGGGGAGWELLPATSIACVGGTVSFSIVPNGTGGGGGCPAGCGNGVYHPNIGFALYDNTWPFGNYIGLADSSPISFGALGFYNVYAYKVDLTNGNNPPLAVMIDGGCGSGTVNNNASVSTFAPQPPIFSQTPTPACVGDTVEIFNSYSLPQTATQWSNVFNLSPLTPLSSYTLVAVITGDPAYVDYSGIDGHTCPSQGSDIIDFGLCQAGSITGDTTVCAGYAYTYSASISGALTYTWTFPSGWYNITGQGTANVSATCNINAGNICVEGFDALNNSVGTLCLTTQFGGGIPLGWDVQPQNITACPGDPYVLNIVPNSSGSGSCPNSCGSGTAVASIAYAVYDDVWPFGNFVGFANGTILPVPAIPGNYTYYIYNIDYTNGTSTAQAVRIGGGCGTSTVNNIAQLYIPVPILPSFYQMPYPVCIGDTVYITPSGVLSGSLGPLLGVTQLSGNAFIVNSMPAHLSFNGLDINGCPVSDICYISVCGPTTLPGDTIVCAGYSYNYTANISGAITYQWLFPTGWYDLTGQGTANVSATCNVNAGWISVSGLDALGNIVGVEMLLTQFGGGSGAGWDVQPSSVSGCNGNPFTLSIIPNGSGGGPGCPPGCGNGTLHPNIIYGVYDNVWPVGMFVGYADGTSIMLIGNVGSTVYVYQVDVTNGVNPPLAVRIEGGCGSSVVNNVCTVSPFLPIPPNYTQTPMPACVGDTIQLLETTGIINPCWGCIGTTGLNFISPGFSNPLIAVVTSANPSTDVTGIDANGCITYISVNVFTASCNSPSISFASSDTVFCDKQSISFFDFSSNNPTSWQWTFTGAIPSTSTQQNPTGIYYATDGSFDVQLIACNFNGCDTLTLTNFIVEYPAPVPPTVYGNTGTLYCTSSASYSWYLTGNPTILSTDSFFVPTQLGSYYCIVTDTNGCIVSSNVFAITQVKSIAQINSIFEINPNPNDGNFEIVLNDKFKNQKNIIKIYNSLGEIVFEKEFLPQQISSSAVRIFTQLDNGTYLMEVLNADEIYRHKFLVSK